MGKYKNSNKIWGGKKKFNHKNHLQTMNGVMKSADKPLNKRM
jgi:hypothetical protein